MTIALSTPVTGSAQTGFTSPSSVVVSDTFPNGSNGKQWAVTSSTGASGINAGSVSSPFTFAFTRPQVYKILSAVNPVTGQLRSVGRNVYKAITRKGVVPLAGQATEVMLNTTEFSVPAGSDVADAVNIRAGVSFHIGCLNQLSAGIGDTIITGSL